MKLNFGALFFCHGGVYCVTKGKQRLLCGWDEGDGAEPLWDWDIQLKLEG